MPEQILFPQVLTWEAINGIRIHATLVQADAFTKKCFKNTRIRV